VGKVTEVTTRPPHNALEPREIARRIEYRLRPWWVVWYGLSTKDYWAMAAWVSGVHGMLSAPDPNALDAAIAAFEMLHPKPMERYLHALGH
jgi:predicted branched-subunit amino acid permease